jgi:hypothetical protein
LKAENHLWLGSSQPKTTLPQIASRQLIPCRENFLSQAFLLLKYFFTPSLDVLKLVYGVRRTP